MTTRQNPMAGRYFNDPNFAAAVSNLAGAFAPPSPEEYLTAEKVKGLRTSNAALADAYGLAGGDFDKLGIVADLYDPSNSYYSVDTDAATARRGQDVAAATALDKARIDGTYGLAGTKLGYGDTMPGLPPEIAAAIGAPAFGAQSGAALGAPAPLMNESEMMAAIIGQQDPATQRALLDPSTVNTVGPNGQPVITSEIDAIGQNAFVNPGSEAAPDLLNYQTADGREGTAIFDPATRKLTDAATGTELPPGTSTFKLQGGDKDAMTGGTTSNQTAYNNIQAITAESDMLVDSLVTLVNSQAGAVGLVGTVQNLQQNVGQVLAELQGAFGDGDTAISRETLMEFGIPTDEEFNPTYAKLRKGILDLAYLEANKGNPGGEVSRFALERQLETLSQGMLANDQSFLASMSMIKEGNARARAAAEARIGNTVTPPGAPTAAPVATGTLSPEAMKWLEGP